MSADQVSLDHDAIRARADAATPGPWGVDGEGTTIYSRHTDDPMFLFVAHEDHVDGFGKPSKDCVDDAEFIAHARTDVPALLDENARLRAALYAVNALHLPIRVYDECQCPEGTHPEEYEYIDCYSYAGCENTFTHWACEECCTDGGRDYISERCADSHRHDKDEAHRCPTVQAIEASE